MSAARPPGECQTLGAVLAAIPEASLWLELLKSAGLDVVVLGDRSVQKTLLVPINSAFTAGIDASPLRPETTLGALITNSPDARIPLAGYSGKC